MDRLPTELIHLITQFLSTPSRAALARASRRYYQLLRLYVYTDVFLDDSSLKRCSTSIFLQIIIHKPELALAVRSLHLDPWDTESDVKRRTEEVVAELQDAWDLNLFKKVVHENPRFAKDAQLWYKGLEMLNTDAFIALAMPRFANLRRLGIEYPYGCTFFDRVITEDFEGGSVVELFPKLEELHIAWYDTENGINARKATPFFSIPSLRKIDLDNSKVSDGLPAWIKLCRELKSFRFVYGGMTSMDTFTTSPFGDTLELHAKTLERLWIELTEPEDMCVDDDRPWIGSLANYTALKVLCMPLAILLNCWDAENDALSQGPTPTLAEVVPPSLEVLVLEIGECESAWLPGQLEHMLRTNRCPRLKLLVVSSWARVPWQEKFEGVRRLCGEAGVALKSHYARYLYSVWPPYSVAGVEPESEYWDSDEDGSAIVL
ncbi:hypothetical protein BJX63DRAFT_428955 [Aspergillus granulosus]|uniref:F-box domain-containing protein n=1 Tax=Aspergillus granulosus TaxID=176169 RepID=A0ABR4HU13_9EURO